MKIAVQFGAGNIGRGFMGQLFWESGFQTVFVDADASLVESLNKHRRYPLRLLDAYTKKQSEVMIDRVTAVAADHVDKIARTIADARIVGTAVGVKNLEALAMPLAAGIKHRFRNHPTPLDVYLCENVLGAAALLETSVARLLDETLRKWAKENVGFVGTSVARMVPAAKNRSELEDSGRTAGLVVADSYHKLPYDGPAVRAGDPGVEGFYPVANFPAEVERKLFTHNLGHAALAYLGYLKGYTYIHEPFGDRFLSSIFEGALDETTAALLKKYPHDILAHEHREVRQDVRIRFSNPMIMDTITRVAKDPLRKLGKDDRLIGGAKLCLSEGVFPQNIAYICGAALCYDFEGDAEAVSMQKMICKNGLGSTLREISDVDSDDKFGQRVVASYHELQRIRQDQRR